MLATLANKSTDLQDVFSQIQELFLGETRFREFSSSDPAAAVFVGWRPAIR